MDLPREAALASEGGGTPPPGWPASGTLKYCDVTAAYRPGLPPVLCGISFELQVRVHIVVPYVVCHTNRACLQMCGCADVRLSTIACRL